MQELNARFDLLQGINDNLRRWNVEQNMKIDAVTKANNELEALVAKKVVELNAYRAKTQELGKAIDELRHELRELKQANKK
jgi:chromosome segregation ATPase